MAWGRSFSYSLSSNLLSLFSQTHTLTFLCIITENPCGNDREKEKKKSPLGENREIRSDSE